MQNNKAGLSEFSKITPKSTQEKLTYLFALSNCQDTNATQIVHPYLSDNISEVRESAAFALGQYNCDMAENILITKLKSEQDYLTISQILYSLGKIGDSQTVDTILGLNITEKYPDAIARSFLYFFSNGVINDEMVRICVSLLHNHNTIQASLALSRANSQEIVLPYLSRLIKIANNSTNDIKANIVKAIMKYDYPEKHDIICSFLKDNDYNVRIEAIRGITNIDLNDTIWDKILSDPNYHVIATGLVFLPEKLDNYENLKSLLSHKSKHIQGKTIEYLVTTLGSEALDKLQIPQDNSIVKYIAQGLANNQKSKELQKLIQLSYHKKNSVSTPAYTGLIQLGQKLVLNNKISLDSMSTFIRLGLQSNNSTQIAIAADAMKDSLHSYNHLLPQLYSIMESINSPESSEAIISLLSTIEYLKPKDAEEIIWKYQNSNYSTHKAVQNILKNVYGINESDNRLTNNFFTNDINLHKLNKYGLYPEVEILTNKGKFSFQCDGFHCPFTTSAILKLVEDGYYNNLTFHRVVPNFVIQGGDPRGDGWGGPDFTLLTERSPKTYLKGSVGIASAGPDTEGSQFFVTLSSQPHLDYRYTNFGMINSGIDIVELIEVGDIIISAKIIK